MLRGAINYPGYDVLLNKGYLYRTKDAAIDSLKCDEHSTFIITFFVKLLLNSDSFLRLTNENLMGLPLNFNHRKSKQFREMSHQRGTLLGIFSNYLHLRTSKSMALSIESRLFFISLFFAWYLFYYILFCSFSFFFFLFISLLLFLPCFLTLALSLLFCLYILSSILCFF